MKTLILAKNAREAGSYAASMGIPRQHFRAVQKAAAIRSVRSGEIHLLPGFFERRDRFGMLAAMRNSRLPIFYVDPADVRESSNDDIPESSRTTTDDEPDPDGDAMESEGAPVVDKRKRTRKPPAPARPVPAAAPTSYFE